VANEQSCFLCRRLGEVVEHCYLLKFIVYRLTYVTPTATYNVLFSVPGINIIDFEARWGFILSVKTYIRGVVMAGRSESLSSR
jgi:hypothetical protein